MCRQHTEAMATSCQLVSARFYFELDLVRTQRANY